MFKRENILDKVNRTDTRQGQILAFIRDYTAVHGYSPTVREIGSAVGMSSTSSVQAHLDRMEDFGIISKGNGPRTITILDDQLAGKTNIPVVKRMTTEDKLFDKENITGYVSVPWASDDKMLFMKAGENGLVGDGIMAEDMVLLRLTNEKDKNGCPVAEMTGYIGTD